MTLLAKGLILRGVLLGQIQTEVILSDMRNGAVEQLKVVITHKGVILVHLEGPRAQVRTHSAIRFIMEVLITHHSHCAQLVVNRHVTTIVRLRKHLK